MRNGENVQEGRHLGIFTRILVLTSCYAPGMTVHPCQCEVCHGHMACWLMKYNQKGCTLLPGRKSTQIS